MATSELQDLEAAELAYERVKSEIDAVSTAELSPINVDVVSATSIVLGFADRILSFRERIAKLPEFEVRHVDRLVDYAKAAWYVYVTNLPAPEPENATQLSQEVAALRSKLLLWAVPLVGSGLFDETAVAKIREGSGNKDLPSDLVALVGLYRSNWEQVKNIIGVTEQDLTRGAEIGPAVFALVSRRENKGSAPAEASLRVRRAWTLVDRAYAQARRAIAYLRWEEGDVDSFAPSLRKNSGVPRASDRVTATPPEDAASTTPAVSTGGPEVNLPPGTGAVIGAGNPFAKN